MNRAINDSVAQMVRKYEEKPTRLKTVIHRVHYVSRRLTVGARGYGIIKRVPVQQGIELGTPDAQIVTEGNTAWLERQPDGTWLCTAVRTKTRCATGTAADVVEVDTAVDSSVGYTTNDFAASIVPDSLFLPPFELMGMITLPSLQFPDPTQYLCGIPQCTNCAPDGYSAGMTLILSSDVDHPAGCWVWGFRSGGCSGSPVFDALLEYDTTLFGGATFTVGQAKLYASDNYVYAATWKPGSAYGKIHVVDVTDPTTPTVIGSDDIPITVSTELLVGVWYHAGNAYVTISSEGSTVPTCFSNTYVYDVTTPSTPTLTDTLTWSFAWTQRSGQDNSFEIYTVAGTVYMIGQHNDESQPVGSQSGFRIADITNLASPTVVGTAIVPVAGVIWGNQDYNSGLFFVERTNPIGNIAKIDIYDVSDPTTPTLVATFTANGSQNQLRASANYLYIGIGSTDEFQIVDISTPASPSSVSITALDANPNDLDYCGDFVYIPKSDGVIEAFDVSTPATPVSSGTASTTDYFPRTVQVQNQVVFVNGTRATSPAYPALVTMDS